MDYVPGGEFFTHMRDNGPLHEIHARFYVAQVGMGAWAWESGGGGGGGADGVVRPADRPVGSGPVVWGTVRGTRRRRMARWWVRAAGCHLPCCCVLWCR